MTDYKKIILEKLTYSFADLHNSDDWNEIFSSQDADAIADALYNSFCDSVFWIEAGVKLSEISGFFFDTYGDYGMYAERFAEITDCYLREAAATGDTSIIL